MQFSHVMVAYIVVYSDMISRHWNVRVQYIVQVCRGLQNESAVSENVFDHVRKEVHF